MVLSIKAKRSAFDIGHYIGKSSANLMMLKFKNIIDIYRLIIYHLMLNNNCLLHILFFSLVSIYVWLAKMESVRPNVNCYVIYNTYSQIKWPETNITINPFYQYAQTYPHQIWILDIAHKCIYKRNNNYHYYYTWPLFFKYVFV